MEQLKKHKNTPSNDDTKTMASKTKKFITQLGTEIKTDEKAQQINDEFIRQFKKTLSEYKNGQYDISERSLIRLIYFIIEEDFSEVEKKEILGKCYLLLGAIYEKKENATQAEENYRKAKDEYGIQSINGIKMDNLNIFKMVFKKEKTKIEQPVKKLDQAHQERDILLKVRRIYQQGDYEGSIKLLSDFIYKMRSRVEQKKNAAEAFYLLAKIYYEVGDDTKVNENLRKCFDTFPAFTMEETNLGFKDRVYKIRKEVLEEKNKKN